MPIYCFIFQSASQEKNNNYLELNRRTRGIWAGPAQRRMKQYSVLFLQVGQETTNLIPAKRQKQFILVSSKAHPPKAQWHKRRFLKCVREQTATPENGESTASGHYSKSLLQAPPCTRFAEEHGTRGPRQMPQCRAGTRCCSPAGPGSCRRD